MILLLLLAFAGSLAGIFLLLGMTPFAFAEDITRPFARKKKPIARRIEETVNPQGAEGHPKNGPGGQGGDDAHRERRKIHRPVRRFLLPAGGGHHHLHRGGQLLHAAGPVGGDGPASLLVCTVHFPQL